jgi:hypothetical protein
MERPAPMTLPEEAQAFLNKLSVLKAIRKAQKAAHKAQIEEPIRGLSESFHQVENQVLQELDKNQIRTLLHMVIH